MFVRLFIDENLDKTVPISRQPKDKIAAILESCHRQFPELQTRARKRIRTYLKSCRRTKKIQSMKNPTGSPSTTSANTTTSTDSDTTAINLSSSPSSSPSIVQLADDCLRLSEESLNSPAYHLNSAVAERILADALDNEMNKSKRPKFNGLTSDQVQSSNNLLTVKLLISKLPIQKIFYRMQNIRQSMLTLANLLIDHQVC